MNNSSARETTAFEVRSIEWLINNKDLLDSSFRSPLYQILWIKQGAGRYCVDLERYSLASNTIYFVPAGRMQQIRAEGDLKGYALFFSPELLHMAVASPNRAVYDEMMAGFSGVNIVPVNDRKVESVLLQLLEEMVHEFQDFRLLRTEILCGLLKVFLIYLRRTSFPNVDEIRYSKISGLCNSFCARVDKLFLTKKMVADYADDLSVTPGYLTEVVKRVTGYSASHHIQQRRVLEAKRLAVYTGDNMKSIAYKLGFEDVSHFSRFFKKFAGISFSEFKRKGAFGSNVQPA